MFESMSIKLCSSSSYRVAQMLCPWRKRSAQAEFWMSHCFISHRSVPLRTRSWCSRCCQIVLHGGGGWGMLGTKATIGRLRPAQFLSGWMTGVLQVLGNVIRVATVVVGRTVLVVEEGPSRVHRLVKSLRPECTSRPSQSGNGSSGRTAPWWNKR